MRRSNVMYFWYFKRMLLFYDFAWFYAASICVYFQYLFMHCVCANIFGAIVFNLRFKIDVVVMIIWSIINSVLTLQVLTASLPHDRKPCEIKVVSNHTCSLHTCVCAGWRRVRVRLSGFRWQGISSTPRGFLKCPIPVRVGAEQYHPDNKHKVSRKIHWFLEMDCIPKILLSKRNCIFFNQWFLSYD